MRIGLAFVMADYETWGKDLEWFIRSIGLRCCNGQGKHVLGSCNG